MEIDVVCSMVLLDFYTIINKNMNCIGLEAWTESLL